MPRPRSKERIACRYFTWLVGRRDDVWQADGRANQPAVGRHSLGTADYDEAKRLLVHLDLTLAAKHGLADPLALEPTQEDELPLDEGRRR